MQCETEFPLNTGSTPAFTNCIDNKIKALAGECSQNPTVTGIVDKHSLGDIDALLSGNLAAILVSGLVCIVVSLIKPQNFDWNELKTKTDGFLVENDKHAHLAKQGEDSAEAMDKAFKYCVIGAIVLSFVLVVLWPALALPAKVFDKKYFAFWVAIAFIWGHFAFIVTVLLPIWEFCFPTEEGEYEKPVMKPVAFVICDTAITPPFHAPAMPVKIGSV